MGNIALKAEKFKVKNETQYSVFVMLTREKYTLNIENIQPGLEVGWHLGSYKPFKGSSANSKMSS